MGDWGLKEPVINLTPLVPTDSGQQDAAASDIVIVIVGERNGAIAGQTTDTTIKSYDATLNFASAGFIGAWAPMDGTPSTPGLLRFELAQWNGRTVTWAKLEVATATNVESGFEGEEIIARAVTEQWIDTECSYNNRITGVPWSQPGAGGSVQGAIVGQVVTASPSDEATIELDRTTVQGWIDNPGQNLGVILLSDGDAAGGNWLASSENAAAERRPLLRLALEQ